MYRRSQPPSTMSRCKEATAVQLFNLAFIATSSLADFVQVDDREAAGRLLFLNPMCMLDMSASINASCC